MSNIDFYEFGNILPFWKDLSEEDRILLSNNTTLKSFDKNENVHGTKTHCTGIILVKNGSLRVYIQSEEGREVTLYRIYQGEACSLGAACVLKCITFDVFMEAETRTEVYIINPQIYRKIAENNLRLENYALTITVERFSDVMWTIQQILFLSMDKRLAIFLLDEINKKGNLFIEYTQEEIAKYIGSAREVVSRVLKYFANESILKTSRQGIEILDKKRLMQIAY